MSVFDQNPMPTGTRRLLLVDDEPRVLEAIRRSVTGQGLELMTARSGEEGLEILRRAPCEVVCTDAVLPGMSGVDFLLKVRSEWPLTELMMLTGRPDLGMLSAAVNDCRVFRLMTKPWSPGALLATFTSAFQQYHLVQENERLRALVKTQRQLRAQHDAEELEQKIQQRTAQISRAKREWELSFDAVPDPVWIVQKDYSLRRANLAAARLVQLDIRALPGQKCHELLFKRPLPCPCCPMAEARARNAAVTTEFEVPGLRTYWVQASPVLDGTGACVCSYREITEQKRFTQNLLHHEKMIALGQLAGGIAHEINNPVAGILAFAQIMLSDDGRSDEDIEALRMIEKGAVRCSRVVQTMLRFARGGAPQREAVSLEAVIRDTLLLFEVMCKTSPRVQLEEQITQGLPPILGDAQQLQQVFLNLLQNALQALPGREGTISVRASAGPGTVFVEIADTGAGILPENLPHIFEPTFSTKPVGEGTGFGLAIVQNIIAAHHGTIAVRSEPDVGTTFTLTFPQPIPGEIAAPAEGGGRDLR